MNSLSRGKKALPEFRLILQAPDHPNRPITHNTLKDIFIICAAESLAEISDIIKEANQTRKLRVLFVHLDILASPFRTLANASHTN